MLQLDDNNVFVHTRKISSRILASLFASESRTNEIVGSLGREYMFGYASSIAHSQMDLRIVSTGNAHGKCTGGA